MSDRQCFVCCGGEDSHTSTCIEHYLPNLDANVNRAKASLLSVSDEKINKRAEILKTAESLINGDRADTYGPPEISFGRIGKLWNAMGIQIYDGAVVRDITAVDVAMAMSLMKVSRIIGQPDHEDSWVDGAGYLALGAEMALRDARQSEDK